MCFLVTNSQQAENKTRQCLRSSKACHWSELRIKKSPSNCGSSTFLSGTGESVRGCTFVALEFDFAVLFNAVFFSQFLLLEKLIKSDIKYQVQKIFTPQFLC